MTPSTPQFYSAFGLRIRSDLALPELSSLNNPAAAEADVEITVGPAGAGIEHPMDEGPTFRTAPGRFDMEIEGVGRFQVSEGRKIRVEPGPDATEQLLRVFVLGSALGALLHQRGLLPMHASAIRVGEGAVLFAGRSGVGKSTTLGAFAKRGYAALSDDVTAIRFNEAGEPLALPSFPATRLCEDAAIHLDRDDLEHLPRMPLTPKFVAPIDHFWDTELPVAAIFLINLHNEPKIDFKQLTGADCVAKLIRSTYRRRFLEGFGLKDTQFAAVSRLAAATPVTEIRRPPDLSRLDEMLDQIEQRLPLC